MQGKHEMQSSVSLYFLSAYSGRFLSALQQNFKKKQSIVKASLIVL